MNITYTFLDREEALREDYSLDNQYDEDEDAWTGDDNAWNEEAEDDGENDEKDENDSYIQYLNEEAKNFKNFENHDDDELGEETLLETPLDRIEPYILFRDALLSSNCPLVLS